jgi:glc operon protein GlcG
MEYDFFQSFVPLKAKGIRVPHFWPVLPEVGIFLRYESQLLLPPHFSLANQTAVDTIPRMFKSLIVMFCLMSALAAAADLPSKKYLNLAAIKTLVAGAEAEAKRQNVSVTICIVDDTGQLLFLQKADGVSMNTIEFAQRKAKHAALYGAPSKDAADRVKSGDAGATSMPSFFPVQGGLPIKVDGQTIGAIACSGAKSEVDEAIAQAGIDALLKK